MATSGKTPVTGDVDISGDQDLVLPLGKTACLSWAHCAHG